MRCKTKSPAVETGLEMFWRREKEASKTPFSFLFFYRLRAVFGKLCLKFFDVDLARSDIILE